MEYCCISAGRCGPGKIYALPVFHVIYNLQKKIEPDSKNYVCKDCSHIGICPGNCGKCLDEVHLSRGENERKDYDCNYMMDYYVGRYMCAYVSENKKAFEVVESGIRRNSIFYQDAFETFREKMLPKTNILLNVFQTAGMKRHESNTIDYVIEPCIQERYGARMDCRSVQHIIEVYDL